MNGVNSLQGLGEFLASRSEQCQNVCKLLYRKTKKLLLSQSEDVGRCQIYAVSHEAT